MHDGRDAAAPIGLDRTSKQHELVTGRTAADLEPFVGVFRHDAGGKRPEVLAVLDALIEGIAHVRPPWVGEERTVAERARPELHAALKPGDDLAVGDHVGGIAPGRLAAPSGETGGLHRGENFASIERGAEERRRVTALDAVSR